MKALPPRPIQADDPVETFDSGVEQLNTWLAHQSLTNQANGDSRTYVSIDADSGRILGFYSLASGAVSRGQAGGWLSRNAPDPVPVILLGRLAIDLTAQGQGLGHQLLIHAMRAATGVAAIVGARALVVEAINDTAVKFYLHEGFRLSARRADLLYASLR